MNKELFVVDTTLRDGEQQAGKVFSKEEKINIAKKLDDFGVYQIEAGIPIMGEEEQDCICSIIKAVKKAKVSTWNRINENDIKASFKCKPDIIHISAPVSDIHIFKNLGKDRIWVEEKIKSCIYLAKSNNYDVVIGLEDASRADENYIIHLCKIIKELGVERVRFSDTLGLLTIEAVKNSIRNIINNVDIEVEFHGHNDFGMAIPLSLVANRSGAKYIDCTIDGIGERTGNTDLFKFANIFNIN